MKRTPKAFVQAAQTHRNRLNKVLLNDATGKMKKLYDSAQGSLVSKIAASVRAGRGTTFGVHQQRMVLAQLRQGQALITKRMAKDMTPLSKNAQIQSLKGLVSDVAKLHELYTGSELTLPVDEAATFAGVVQRRASSLLRANERSMANYGVNIVGSIEQKLSLALLQATPLNDVMDDIAEHIDGEWWQGERIVRTEMAMAFNGTHADGIAESAAEIPELRQRWEEHCDDDGAPLDDRVCVDSIAMHSQVAKPGELFFMPSTAPFADSKGRTEVPKGLIGLAWEFPPNRPNDRAALMPWMPDWGVPGWRYVGGRRVPV